MKKKLKFSERIGKTPVRTALQIESIDVVLENRLWNTLLTEFFDWLEYHGASISSNPRADVCKHIWLNFFKYRIDEMPSLRDGQAYFGGIMMEIRDWYFKSNWYEKYDFIEFISQMELNGINFNFVQKCNKVLENEIAGYRIIDGNIVQITSEEEIVEIEEVLSYSDKYMPAKTHISTALELISDRESPDYRNSIKESISAVESLCIIMTGDKDATLGKALTVIEKEYQIHGALKSAFSSLYGYTSDSGGIRHSLLNDDIEVTFEDAKFMLVSCSAFINYLISKH